MANIYGESKLAFHREKLESFKRGEITPPIYVRLKPTNKCNHRCYYCGYVVDKGREWMDRVAEIPYEKMMEILENFKDMGVKAVTLSGGGEPLVYPRIKETMQRILDFGIDLSIITNGQELKGENAKILSQAEWVRISSDAGDAKTFSEIRRVPESWFDTLTENIKNFAKIKKPECEFGINFVVQKKNYDKVYDSIKHFKELGVNHIKITPCWMPNFKEYHKDMKDSVIKQIEKAREDFEDENFKIYDTYEKDFEHSGVNMREYEKCYHMQTVPVIGADCKVYFCHDKAYKPDGVLGSVKNVSFKKLWFSDEARRIFESFNPQECCKHHCANDNRNIIAVKMLGDLENIERYQPVSNKHKNFI